MRFLAITISAILVLNCVYSAKILGVFHMEVGSHYILGTKLMKGLAEAGHDVTMISPRKFKNPPKNGSWTDVVMNGFGAEFAKLLQKADLSNDSNRNFMERMKVYSEFLLGASNLTLRHPEVQKLIRSDATFDVVIIEQLLNECHYGFAFHFKCPIIVLSSIGPNVMVNNKVGNPAPTATVPNFDLRNVDSKKLTFTDRLKNLFHNNFYYLLNELYLFPLHNAVLHEIFPAAPDLHDLIYNTSLILLNSHTSLVEAVPVVPNMVEVGGYHIDPPQKLPKDLQDFLDSAKDGAIYFSMGSNFKSKDMPENKKKAILNVFRKLKQNILWKFEDDLPGKPDNVLIKSWLPQQDILAHPNIKLFITHGGLLSTTETIYHGVPVLAIPVFGDQEMNALKAVQNGFGLKISYNDDNFNEEVLNQLIQELLNNPKYKENAQMRSRIYHDRPLTPMQTAVYWVEYIIRHKGAPHLRVAGPGMPWYEYFMIDVISVFIGGIVLVTFCIIYVCRKLIVALVSSKNSHIVKKKKTN